MNTNMEQDMTSTQRSATVEMPQGNTVTADNPIPPPQEYRTGPCIILKIEIRQQDYGYVVTVGCSTFCIETKEKLISKLTEYLTYPALTEKRWQERTLFNY